MNPYEIVTEFEKTMADYAKSPYAVAVDSCTNALFLCCKYLNARSVTIPKKTYFSVPASIIHAGGKVRFDDTTWHGAYKLRPYAIFDSACWLARGMYSTFEVGAFVCLSFSNNKLLPIGKGGMILHSNSVADAWFRRARYLGREGKPLLEDTIEMLGWNMYMTPEQAARGLSLSQYLKDDQTFTQDYPDLSLIKVFQ